MVQAEEKLVKQLGPVAEPFHFMNPLKTLLFLGHLVNGLE